MKKLWAICLPLRNPEAFMVTRHGIGGSSEFLYTGDSLDPMGSLSPWDLNNLMIILTRLIYSRVEKNHATHYLLEFADEIDMRRRHACVFEVTCYAGARYAEEDTNSFEIIADDVNFWPPPHKKWRYVSRKGCMDRERDIASRIRTRIRATLGSHANTNGCCMCIQSDPHNMLSLHKRKRSLRTFGASSQGMMCLRRDFGSTWRSRKQGSIMSLSVFEFWPIHTCSPPLTFTPKP